MSRFGDSNSHMNYLYENLEEFFEVLRYFFEDFKI